MWRGSGRLETICGMHGAGGGDEDAGAAAERGQGSNKPLYNAGVLHYAAKMEAVLFAGLGHERKGCSWDKAADVGAAAGARGGDAGEVGTVWC
jgi:hypothetical protein